jgi:hypothetical protein
MMLTKTFWLDAFERASRTFIQTFFATLPAQAVADNLASGEYSNLKVLGLQAIAAAIGSALSLLTSMFVVSKSGTISPASFMTEPVEVDPGADQPGDADDSSLPVVEDLEPSEPNQDDLTENQIALFSKEQV